MQSARRFTKLLTLTLLPLLLTLAAPGRAAATLMVVDLITDYQPVEEFAAVRTRLASWTGPSIVRTAIAPALSSTDYLAGTRIAEFPDVPYGIYLVTVDLLDGAGDAVARRPVLVDFFVDFAVTSIIARPAGSVEKSAALLVDADGDGAVSGGDTVRYSVVALGSGGERFVDELSPELTLVAGSVATTHGLVLEGNGPGDTRVEVVDMGLTGAGTAVIEFDAVLAPEVSNQGEMLFELGSFDPAVFDTSYFSRRIRSDDPGTLLAGDPTRTPVACDLAACAGDLEECTDDLDSCETERLACEDDLATCAAERAALEDQVAMLEAELGMLMADPDGDGTPAVLDLCPDSEPGAPVDDRGCTIAQFCAAIDLSQPQGNNLCNHADWLGDEPLGSPNDCHPAGGVCAPR